MNNLRPFWITAWLLLAGASIPGQAATVKVADSKMGSAFEVTAVADDEAMAHDAVAAAYAEIDRIEDLISSWRETSETSRVNREAGRHPVAVSAELFNLIRRSLKLSELTEGAFDVTFAPAGSLWDISKPDPKLPSADAVREALASVGWHFVELDSEAQTVRFTQPGVRIGFGAIGKGYAANRAVMMMKGLGIDNGVVNAGGDLVAFGRREDGSPWRIGIANPKHPDQTFAMLDVVDQAVVTSGDYERFVLIDGKRYAHIVDPRTGYPVEGVQSATVICPDGELADGLATALFVLGTDHGLQLVDQLNGIEALVVDAEGQFHFSKNLERDLSPREAPP